MNDADYIVLDSEGLEVNLKVVCPVCGLVFRGFNLGGDFRCTPCVVQGKRVQEGR